MTDISTTSWSETDSGNNQQPPEGWPAGMNANGVEPSARMNMGAVKRFWNRVNPTYLAALATTDSYTISPTQAITGYGLYETWNVRFPSPNTSTSPNILISSLPAQPIRKYSASSVTALAAGDIQGTQAQQIYWDGTEFILSTPASSIADATNGGLNFSAATGNVTAKIQPSDLATKASPTSSDSLVISDGAASSQAKSALISAMVASAATAQAGTDNNQWLTSLALGNSFTRSGANHLYKFPGGNIVQMFTSGQACGSNATTTVSFPTTFPTACDGVVILPNAAPTTGTGMYGAASLSTSNCAIANLSGTSFTPYVIAWGH